MALLFVSKAIDRILKDAPRKAFELRNTCESYLATQDKKFNIILILKVLMAACESGTISLIVTALDTVQKLIAYGCFGSEHIVDPELREKTCASVIQSICNCAEICDEKVDLQVVKALLAAHSTQTFQLNVKTVNLAVRTCFKIVLGSDTPMIEATGIATLTQMLEKIATITEDDLVSEQGLGSHEGDGTAAGVENKETVTEIEPPVGGSATSENSKTPEENQSSTSSVEQSSAPSNSTENEKASAEQPDPKVDAAQVSKDADAAVESKEKAIVEGTSTDEKKIEDASTEDNTGHEAKDAQLAVEDERKADSNETVADTEPESDGKSAPEESKEDADSNEKENSEGTESEQKVVAEPKLAIKIPTIKVEKAAAISPINTGSSGKFSPYGNGDLDKFQAIGIKEAISVFQTVCSFSIKDVSVELLRKSHTMALKLLKLLLEKGSDYFCEAVIMDHTARDFLVSALLRNSSMSFQSKSNMPADSVYLKFVGGDENSIAVEILLLIVLRVRHALKLELGMLIPTIVLQPLEELSLAANQSENTYESKNASNGIHSGDWSSYNSNPASSVFDTSRNIACIDFLCTIAKEPQILVDIFVNYDCDWEGQNLYERIVKALAKSVQISSGRSEFGKKSIEALHYFLKSLTIWAEVGGEQDDGSDTSDSHSSAQSMSGPMTPRSVPTPRTAQQQVFRNAMSLEQERNRKMSLVEGISIFNKKPAKGIICLQKSGHLANGTPDDIASFLKSMARKSMDPEAKDLRVSLTAMGEYFGSPEEDAIAALHAFVRLIDFKNMRLDEAVRRLLTYFRLPGEAQKIDRIMEALSVKYVQDNPNEFQNSDAAYVLSYSIMMLNTDAHNPMLTHRMSKSDFISNLSDVKELEGVEREMIEGIFDRVTENEIKMTESDTSATAGKGANGISNRKSLTNIFGLLGLNESRRREASEGAISVKDIIKKTREMLKQLRPESGEEGQNKYTTTTDSLLARPMAQVACPVILHAFLCLLGFEYLDDQSTSSSPRSSSPPSSAQVSPSQAPHLRRLPTEKVIDILDSLAHHGNVHQLSYITECSLLAMAYIAAVDFPPRMMPHYSARAVQLLFRRAECDAHRFSGIAWVVLLEVISRVEALVGGQTGFTHASEGGGGVSEKNVLKVSLATVEAGGCALLSPHCESISPDAQSGEARSPHAESDELSESQVFSGILPSVLPVGGGFFSFRFPPPANEFVLSSGEDSKSSGANFDDSRLFVSWSSRSPEISVRLAEIATACRGQDWIQRVFERSITLDTVGVVSFTTALAAISRRELLAAGGPRLFSLQKLVEVGHANIPRIRLVWGRVWAVLSEHCVQVALHCNLKVAMYAVDSLKQLASTFLSKESGSDTPLARRKDSNAEKSGSSTNTIHSDVIRPFGRLVRTSDRGEIKELVLDCVQNFASAYGAHLPGQAWTQIFRAIRRPSDEADVSVVTTARRVLSSIILGQDGIGASKESNECKGCQFLKQTAVAKSCLGDCLRCVFSHVVRGGVGEEGINDIVNLYIEIGRHISVYKGFDTESVDFFWTPLQASMAEALDESHVREDVLIALLGLLECFGSQMSESFWKRTFQTIFFPAVDPLLHDILEGNDVDQFLLEISNTVLNRLAHVVANSLPASSSSIASFLELVRRLVCSAGQGGEKLQLRRRRPPVKVVAIALNAVLELVGAAQDSLGEKEWDQIVSAGTELLNIHTQIEKDPDAAPVSCQLEADVVIMVLKLVTTLLRDQSKFLIAPQKKKLVTCIRETFYKSFHFNNSVVRDIKKVSPEGAVKTSNGDSQNNGEDGENEKSNGDRTAGPSTQFQMRQEIEAGGALLSLSQEGTENAEDDLEDLLTQLCDDILAESVRSIDCLYQSPMESDDVDSETLTKDIMESNSVEKFKLLRQLLLLRTSLIVQTLQVLQNRPALFEKRKERFLRYLSIIILTDQLDVRREISRILRSYFEA